jgi:hypothetical protein
MALNNAGNTGSPNTGSLARTQALEKVAHFVGAAYNLCRLQKLKAQAMARESQPQTPKRCEQFAERSETPPTKALILFS